MVSVRGVPPGGTNVILDLFASTLELNRKLTSISGPRTTCPLAGVAVSRIAWPCAKNAKNK